MNWPVKLCHTLQSFERQYFMVSLLLCPEQIQQTTVFMLFYVGHDIKYQVMTLQTGRRICENFCILAGDNNYRELPNGEI